MRNYGRIDLATVIRKSSNVGASKIALSLEPRDLWAIYNKVGLGRVTDSGFPGESAGVMSDYARWRKIERATLAFGYGLSVTPLQLVHSYSVFANDGQLLPASFLIQREPPVGERVMKASTARQVRAMLEAVVSKEGTGYLASVDGYRVAGKTGTVRKSTVGGYVDDRYVAVFSGMAPASNPRLVMVVMINEPTAGKYYGGHVAAPVFSRVMQGALRLLDVAPDDLPSLRARAGDSGGPA